MPRLRKTWAAWNFLGTSSPQADQSPVCVSYWCNRLQNLPAHAPDMFVTLNPIKPPAADKVIRKLKLAHPVYRWAGPRPAAPHAERRGLGSTLLPLSLLRMRLADPRAL
jgi:predicted NAD/FAD-binding protein